MTAVFAANSRQERTRCHMCGRKVGPEVEQCRPVRSGWFCWRDGLTYDPALLIQSTPDPIGEAEQAVIDAYAEPITAAQKAVDEALASHTLAQTAYLAGLREGLEIGVTAGVMIGGTPPRERRATGAERTAMRNRLTELRAGQERTEKRLMKARATLSNLERGCELGRRTAKLTDRGHIFED